MATMPRIRSDLRVLKIYMYGAAMAMQQPLDAQGTLNYLGALVRGDAELFHWLNAFRSATNERKMERKAEQAKPPAGQIVLFNLDEVSEAENAVYDAKNQFLSSVCVQNRVRIIADGQFVPLLIEKASTVTECGSAEFAISDKLLQLIHLLISERFVLTPTGFWRMHGLDKGFLDAFKESAVFNEWEDDRKEHVTTVEEDIQAVKDEMLDKESHMDLSSDEKYFDEPTFLCPLGLLEDAQQKPEEEERKGESDSDDELPAPPPAYESDLPARIELEEKIVLHIFESVSRALQKNTDESKLDALRMIMQLKPVLRHSEAKLRKCMPMLFNAATTKGVPMAFNIENLNVEVPVPSAGVVEGIMGKLRIFDAVAHGFGFRLNKASDVMLSALLQQRVYLPGRSSSEIMHPLNVQHNMYSTELPFLSVELVRDLFEAEGNLGKSKLNTLHRTADAIYRRDTAKLSEAHNRRTMDAPKIEAPVQGSAKKQKSEKGQSASSSSSAAASFSYAPSSLYTPAPYSAFSAASASAAAAAAPSIHPPEAEEYSPSRPFYHIDSPKGSPASPSYRPPTPTDSP